TYKSGAMEGVRYIESAAQWEKPLVVRPDAEPGTIKIPVSASILVCNDRGTCLPPQKVSLEVEITVKAGQPVAVEDKYKSEIAKVQNGSSDPPYDPFNEKNRKPPEGSTSSKPTPDQPATETEAPKSRPEPEAPARAKPAGDSGPKIGTLSFPTTDAYAQ